MKNYFENENCEIIPFESVCLIIRLKFADTDKDEIRVFSNKDFYIVIKDENQVSIYKDWLALKQQALEDSIKPIYAISPLQNKISLDEGITTVSSDYSKPEITEEVINYLHDFYFCSLCRHEDSSNCDSCNFLLHPDKLAELNKEWQENK